MITTLTRTSQNQKTIIIQKVKFKVQNSKSATIEVNCSNHFLNWNNFVLLLFPINYHITTVLNNFEF